MKSIGTEFSRSTGCDAALNDYGIPSLLEILKGVKPGENTFDGRGSTAPDSKYGTVGKMFENPNNTAGAAVHMYVGYPQLNKMFLGPAYFDPGSFGVTGFYSAAQAFIIIHESVHLIGNKYDHDFGGSKNLTRLLVNNCYPALRGKLGGLYN